MLTANIVETDKGQILLAKGGHEMSLDGQLQPAEAAEEYPALYRHFVTLVNARNCDVDLAPLRLVADAFLTGRHHSTAPFVE